MATPAGYINPPASGVYEDFKVFTCPTCEDKQQVFKIDDGQDMICPNGCDIEEPVKEAYYVLVEVEIDNIPELEAFRVDPGVFDEVMGAVKRGDVKKAYEWVMLDPYQISPTLVDRWDLVFNLNGGL